MSDIPVQLLQHLGKHGVRMRQFLGDNFSNVDESQRRAMAKEARQISAWAAAAIAPMPIPFADIWTITPVQMLMVRAIGNIYGYKIDAKTVKEMLAVVGGGMIGQQICLALFKIGLPGAGGFGGAAFVFFWTHGIGNAAELYFQSGMTATDEDLAAARKEGMKQAKNETPLNE